MSKGFFNDPDLCIDEFICGLTACHRGLIQLPGHRIVLRRDLHNVEGKVAIVTGGGSGHEPAFAGFVGKGMLSVVSCSSVFTSSPPSTVYTSIKVANKYKPSGILLLVMNYTGDRINFGMAKEWAASEGIKIEMVIIGEDCALTSTDKSAGRRGLAGGIFAVKIAGALAEKGESLEFISNTLNKVVNNMGTIGVCLRPCVLPKADSPLFTMEDDQIDIGLGLHGEAGVRRTKAQDSAPTIQMMLEHMTDKTSATHIDISPEDEVAVIVNNLGSVSVMEIGIVANDVAKALISRGIKIKKMYMGKFITSLQMTGLSISILKLNSSYYDNISILELLEAKADVPCPLISVGYDENLPDPDLEEFRTLKILPSLPNQPEVTVGMGDIIKKCIISSCNELLDLKEKLNDFDMGSGDGDCGSTHARGAAGILEALKDTSKKDFQYPGKVIQTVGLICCEKMGGTSGALYSIFMAAAARKLSTFKAFDRNTLAQTLTAGIHSIEQCGGARLGDRTLLDVLIPVTRILTNSTDEDVQALCKSVSKVARESAEATVHMKAQAGRASYVSEDRLINPDPGAEAVSSICCTFAAVVMNK